MTGTRIVIVCRGPLETIPPVMNVAMALASHGRSCEVMCSTALPTTISDLSLQGVAVRCIEQDTFTRRRSLSRGLSWVSFRSAAWRVLRDVSPATLLWIAGADTALALGRRLFRRTYILQVHELYDRLWRYRLLMGPVMRHAGVVVVPELGRAGIVRYWYSLSSLPVVLPNRPLGNGRPRKATVSDAFARRSLENVASDARIVLYQGYLRRTRGLTATASAITELGRPWRLVVLGNDDDGSLSDIQRVCPEVIHIRQLTAPLHLDVTSHAHIGIVSYSPDSLNHVFCAPNKLWEYACFGLPSICEDLPPLRAVMSVYGAGICTNLADKDAVLEALLQIAEKYAQFSAGAISFYNSVDPMTAIRDVIERVERPRS